MRALFLFLFLFRFIDTHAQEIEVDLSYKYIFASKWDKAIQTYNFSRPYLTEKQPLFMHGMNGSVSYIFKSENKFKQGINASYSNFSSYAENVNFVNQYNLHFFNMGYMLRHESTGGLKGLCTDFILSASSSALFRYVNDEPYIYDEARSKAFGIGGDLSVRTSYSFKIKNKIRLSPFVQIGYTPYLFSPNTESVINQTRGIAAPNFTNVFSTQVGLRFSLNQLYSENF
jgi:hypothetical protein